MANPTVPTSPQEESNLQVPRYVIGTIAAFVNEDNERCEQPDVLEASDDRNYVKVVLTTDCPEGVMDFADGECYTLFATEAQLLKLKAGQRVRVTSKE